MFYNYFHTLDPFIIQFTQTFGIRWYSMAYIMGFFVGYLCVTKWLIKKNLTVLTKQDISDFVTWVALGVIIGGRLGYALFYSTDLLTHFDSTFPYWELLKIHHGGLASHGGILGMIIGAILFAKKRGFCFYHCLDIAALGSIGIFFGRIANFINGELYGRIIKDKALLSVQFPQEILLWVSQKKIQHLQDLSSVVSHFKIHANTWSDWIYKFESTGQYRSQIYSVIYSILEACEKGNQEIIASLKLIISHRHPSQLYQAILEGLFVFIIVCFLWRKKSIKPGIIAGVASLFYAFMRIIGEQFRMPDSHLGFQSLGLTRGQWLSVFMIVVILIYFVVLFKYKKTSRS